MQVAARELDIPLDKVHIAETATDKVPNTSPSAASASSDLYCMAVIDACSQLKTRLAPFRQPKPRSQGDGDEKPRAPSFAEAVQAAYQAMVDLSARGFHAVTHITGASRDLCQSVQPLACSSCHDEPLRLPWNALISCSQLPSMWLAVACNRGPAVGDQILGPTSRPCLICQHRATTPSPRHRCLL